MSVDDEELKFRIIEKFYERFNKGTDQTPEKEEEEEEPKNYQDFLSECMKRKGGGSEAMSECAKEWKEYKKQLKEEAPTTKEVNKMKEERERVQDAKSKEVPKAKEVEDNDDFNDVLVVTEGCSSCEKVANILAEDILADRIKVVEAKTGQGQNIIAQMPDDISIPFYCLEKLKGYEKRPLRQLLQKYKG